MRSAVLWRLLKLAVPIRGSMALAALLGVATVGSGIGLMATSAYLISAAALHPSVAALSIAVVGVRFFGIARGVFRYLERLVAHRAAFQLLSMLRVQLYQALEPLIPARLVAYAHQDGVSYRSGDLLSRLVSDIDALQNVYIRIIAPPVVAVLVALLVWIVLGAFQPLFVGIFLVFYLFAGIGVPLLAYHLSKRTGQEIVKNKGILKAQIVDSMQGMADLVAYGHEDIQNRLVQQLNAKLAHQQMRIAHVSGLQAMLSNLLMYLATWTMLLTAIPYVQSGQLDGVYLALLVLTVLAGFEGVLPLPAAFQEMGSTLESARRLFEIVDAKGEIQEKATVSPQPRNYDLEIEHVSFSYDPTEPLILDDVSLQIPEGKCLALIGPSGVGKSTLVNLIVRFWDYQQGHIRLGGHELREYRQQDLHQLISVVAQDTHLFNTTIRENILLGRPEASFEEVVQAAKQAHIHDFIKTLPHGYTTQIGEQGMNLSGGERQRIAIARALLKDAPFLILDEATANLDAVTQSEILQTLRGLIQGKTTLLITHRLADRDIADEIVLLQAGKIARRVATLSGSYSSTR